jgi:hypothetical protein
MFARGASPGKVDMWMYDEDDEDFTKGNCSLVYLPLPRAPKPMLNRCYGVGCLVFGSLESSSQERNG